jgi:hypothetical protein
VMYPCIHHLRELDMRRQAAQRVAPSMPAAASHGQARTMVLARTLTYPPSCGDADVRASDVVCLYNWLRTRRLSRGMHVRRWGVRCSRRRGRGREGRRPRSRRQRPTTRGPRTTATRTAPPRACPTSEEATRRCVAPALAMPARGVRSAGV